MKFLIGLLTLVFYMSNTAASEIIRDFNFDKCTAYKSGTKKDRDAWETCCLYHDLEFCDR